MDDANEAPAPDPEPAVAPSEGAEADAAPPVAAEAAASSEAPIAADPPAIPADPPPPPATPTELDAAALAFQPTPFRTVIARPFWAGLLGAGTGVWAGSALQAFSRSYLIPRPAPAIAFFLPLFLAFGAALVLGYRARVQSYAAVVGRLFGVLFFGGISASITVAILALIFDGFHIRDQAAFVTLALAGALLAGLALARIHGITADKSRRIKLAVATSAALLVTIWPAAPSLRCRLGFGEGCRAASGNQDNLNEATALAERGCEHEDMDSCRRAGQLLASPGVGRDLRRAEGFYREGCALGDPESCDGVHELELEQRCDRYGAFACAELGRGHATGEGMNQDRALAQRYYRKACLLGADDACREANGR
jgi:hypothetical protein